MHAVQYGKKILTDGTMNCILIFVILLKTCMYFFPTVNNNSIFYFIKILNTNL